MNGICRNINRICWTMNGIGWKHCWNINLHRCATHLKFDHPSNKRWFPRSKLLPREALQFSITDPQLHDVGYMWLLFILFLQWISIESYITILNWRQSYAQSTRRNAYQRAMREGLPFNYESSHNQHLWQYIHIFSQYIYIYIYIRRPLL